ncbi:MAG: hypothetical protein H6722_05720 [Sandaracinus sp.]|nr:hypothetical protein [Sandaracinus sp.]MCB9621593.1 hypothetical protein [Sandaracinus sp.]
MRALLLPSIFLFACSTPTTRTLPDESADDLGAVQRSHLAGSRAAGPELGGTRWTFVEAACTEGVPPLMQQGFARDLAVVTDDTGLVLLTDDRVGEGCTETVAQHATPGANADAAWSMSEEARVTVGECPTRVEDDRPGDVRLRGAQLEVYVQRSVWCNGLELKTVYAPAQAAPRSPDQLIRHYVLHFNRRDPAAITSLFAEAGALVEPFLRTPENQPTRHDGRQAVFEWYRETLASTPWLALKIVQMQEGVTPGAWVVDWHYMDPRLDAPFAGRNRFTLAGGEIFETSIEITSPRVEVEGLDAVEGQSAPAATGEVPVQDAPEATPAAAEASPAAGAEAESAAE